MLLAWADPSLPVLSSRTELNLHQMAESSAFGMGVWPQVSDGPPGCIPVPGTGWEVKEGPSALALQLAMVVMWEMQELPS